MKENTYTPIKGTWITILMPSIRTFWYDVLWTSTEVDNKIMAPMDMDSMRRILKIITSDQINREVDDKDVKDNILKIEDYLSKTDSYTLIKCVYKHYDILSQKPLENHKLLAHLGMTNSRDIIDLRILGENYQIDYGSNNTSTIQYYAETNTPEIIEEMLLEIAKNNSLKIV